MRIDLDDILDDAIATVEGEHLGDALIRFRFAEPRSPSPYHRFLLERGDDPSVIFPEAPNRTGIEANLEQLRVQLVEAFAAQRDCDLLRRSEVATAEDFLRFNVDHFCRPHWLYTNGQTIVSLVERSHGVLELIHHPSVVDYLGFPSSYGPWPVLEAGRGARFASLVAAETWIGQRLSHLVVQNLTFTRKGEERTVFFQPAGERSGREGRVRTFLIHYWGGVRRERQEPKEAYAFLNRFALDGFRARSCATCAHFAFSGMSRDMSDGRTGYCLQRDHDPEAILPYQALVSVYDTCESHLFIEDAERPVPHLGPPEPEESLSAVSIARIMADNMRENQKDPDFMLKKAIQNDELAAEIIARRRLEDGGHASQEPLPDSASWRTLARGPHASLFVTERNGRPVVVKVARSIPASLGRREPLVEYEALFTTGLVTYGDPDPDEVIRSEAVALNALAPATPPAIESAVGNDGRAYVVRDFVEGESWRQILDRGGSIGLEPLRKLVALLASVEKANDPGFHGDVKPDNIILTPGGEVVLIDPTSAFMRRTPNGPLERALLTGEYNPHFAPSDHAALALTLIEMLTGRQLIAEAAGREATRPIGSRLAESLRFAAAAGTNLFVRRLPAIDLPSEIAPRFGGLPEVMLLRALGLSWERGVLDVGRPLETLRELETVVS